MKSKKKLFETLSLLTGDASWMEEGLKHPEITDETYGDKSMIYIGFKSIEERKVMEDKLESEGFPVNRGYWKGSSCTEVQVSYFKGYNWDK